MQKIAAIFLSAILLAGAITIASPIMINEAAASGKDKKDKKECYRDDSYYDKDHRYYEMCKEHYEECEEYYENDKKHRDYRKGGQYYEECKVYYEYSNGEYNGKDRKYVEKDDRKVKYDPRDKKYDPRGEKGMKYGPQPYDPRNNNENGKDYKYDEETQNGEDRQYIKYDPKPYDNRYSDSKKYGKYYDNPYEPKHPPMKKKVVCEDSGFIVKNVNDCPVKCPDGLYVMQGMECPEIPESFPVCDNGLVVNSTEFCPEKCTEGPFEGFYVMNQNQCPTMNGGMTEVKSNQTVCESCLFLALNTITGAGNLEDLSAALATGFGMSQETETNNAWEVCSADNPVEAYEQTIFDEFANEQGEGIPDPVRDSVPLFEACLCEAGLLPEEVCNEGDNGDDE